MKKCFCCLFILLITISVPACTGMQIKSEVTQTQPSLESQTQPSGEILTTPNDIVYTTDDGKITVRRVDPPENAASVLSDLAPLTEEEVIDYDTSIFRGVVTDTRNISIEYRVNSDIVSDLYSMITVEIEKSIRGNETPGETATILAQGYIGGKWREWAEDTGTTSQIQTGMEGIFMPHKFKESDVKTVGGSSLKWLNVCQYMFPDGERFAFLQKDDGIVYADWEFISLYKPKNLDDVEAYIKGMLDNSILKSFNYNQYEPNIEISNIDMNVEPISDEETAISGAEKALKSIFGSEELKKIRAEEQPYSVKYNPDKKMWLIQGCLEADIPGGVASVIIDDGKVYSVWRGK